MEESEFSEAREDLEALIRDYEESCCCTDQQDESFISEVE